MENINRRAEDTVVITTGLRLTSNTVSWGSAQTQVKGKKKRNK